MNKINFKTEEEFKIMALGGKILSKVKKALKPEVKEGVSALEIEEKASKLINEFGAEPSFKKVPGYFWSTCVNVNDGVVHGIPKKSTILKKGDVVSVDLGVYFQGFHTDSAFSKVIGKDQKLEDFLSVGKAALRNGISFCRKGKKIKDISYAIETTLRKADLTPIWSLTGHGVGRNLHEYPPVPCFVSGASYENLVLQEGMALAIEVMYTKGNGEAYIEKDGWTMRTNDGKIAALFEETVSLTSRGSIVITA